MIREFLFSSGGKKFVLACSFVAFVSCASTALLCLGIVTADQWLIALDKALWATGGYLGLNVAQKLGDAFGDRPQAGGNP